MRLSTRPGPLAALSLGLVAVVGTAIAVSPHGAGAAEHKNHADGPNAGAHAGSASPGQNGGNGNQNTDGKDKKQKGDGGQKNPGPSSGSPAPKKKAPAVEPAWQPVSDTKIANPGLLIDGTRWYMASTGGWTTKGLIRTATSPYGPWSKISKPLLNHQPKWASRSNHSVWAPSLVKADGQHYVVYYAAVVAGQKSARCIGTGYASSPTGPFTPNPRPLACYNGSHSNAYDSIPSEGANFSLIDPTPARVRDQLVLTYKTQIQPKGKPWHTTIRMVRLDPKHPGQALKVPGTKKTSIQLTSSVNKYIEENPVLV